MDWSDKLKILRAIKRLLPIDFNPKIKSGTLCLSRRRPQSRYLCSAVMMVEDKYEIYCVEERTSDGTLHAVTIKLLKDSTEVLNRHFSKAHKWHEHALINGKKQVDHLPVENLKGFVLDIENRIREFS